MLIKFITIILVTSIASLVQVNGSQEENETHHGLQVINNNNSQEFHNFSDHPEEEYSSGSEEESFKSQPNASQVPHILIISSDLPNTTNPVPSANPVHNTENRSDVLLNLNASSINPENDLDNLTTSQNKVDPTIGPVATDHVLKENSKINYFENRHQQSVLESLSDNGKTIKFEKDKIMNKSSIPGFRLEAQEKNKYNESESNQHYFLDFIHSLSTVELIVYSVLIVLVCPTILGFVIYGIVTLYHKRYPVRMRFGRKFSTFENPIYKQKPLSPSLVQSKELRRLTTHNEVLGS